MGKPQVTCVAFSPPTPTLHTHDNKQLGETIRVYFLFIVMVLTFDLNVLFRRIPPFLCTTDYIIVNTWANVVYFSFSVVIIAWFWPYSFVPSVAIYFFKCNVYVVQVVQMFSLFACFLSVWLSFFLRSFLQFLMFCCLWYCSIHVVLLHGTVLALVLTSP